MRLLYSTPSIKNLSLLFFSALIIRGLFFYCYVQHNERYRQADSTDYSTCALLLAYSGTMTRFDTHEPIFWRTPGYPLFLAPFYAHHGITTGSFSGYTSAQKAAIRLQIFLCSLIPIILFFLAQQLTSSLPLSWLTAWISVFHLGFVLAPTYLLTDALASIFFYLFLLFFYSAFFIRGDSIPKKRSFYLFFLLAALCLGAYTWMRPMGKFVGILAGLLILFSYTSRRQKLQRATFFCLLFFATLSPWYIRNYSLTGQWFFCPMSGAYLEAFCAPKIVRRLSGWPLEKCMRALFAQVEQEAKRQETELRASGSNAVVVKHIVCGKIAWPWLKQHPWQFMYDWMVQVFKTAFDLYASQLVAFAHNTFTYDPLEEYLFERIYTALFDSSVPLWMRIIAWLELFGNILLWIGLLGGAVLYLIKPLYTYLRHRKIWGPVPALWLKTVPIIGAVIFMTGGFGYARLRIPIEPLMIIIALTFWLRAYLPKKTSP